jgi:hypothetical protein
MSPVVLFVHVSKSPVSFLPTVTVPPSKHWSQLLAPKAAFDEQLTVLFSPSVELIADDDVVTGTVEAALVVTAVGIGDAVVVAAVVVTGVTVAVVTAVVLFVVFVLFPKFVLVVTGVSPVAENARGVARVATKSSERIFCI